MYYFSLVDGHAPGVEEGNTRISSKYTSGVGYMRPNLNCNCPCWSVLKKRRYFEQYLHPSYRITNIISGLCFLIYPNNKLPPFEALQRAFCGEHYFGVGMKNHISHSGFERQTQFNFKLAVSLCLSTLLCLCCSGNIVSSLISFRMFPIRLCSKITW